ncbi:hypothetical protein FB45DRAFT_915301 [Roridomyces roridus]|uniref:Uncharacterized protein n=1 Tax=Roridomyces roridus TaxID=1738132 RepID=A0AAD7BTB7_9AGAR|nr:hypothetical protein FB45DRAFT_915301 [Roridomyces roridus]
MALLSQPLLFLVLGLLTSPPLARAAGCLECVGGGLAAAKGATSLSLPTKDIIAIVVAVVIFTILCIYFHRRRKHAKAAADAEKSAGADVPTSTADGPSNVQTKMVG